MLDRTRQREVLEHLASVYPREAYPKDIIAALSRPTSADNPIFLANITYLDELGLLKASFASFATLYASYGALTSAKITARGLDFLQDDGGMSAILGVVTVKLHDDTIKALLVQQISASDGDDSAKAKVIEAIRSLPAEATKSIANRLIEHGLSTAPRALAGLQTLLGL